MTAFFDYPKSAAFGRDRLGHGQERPVDALDRGVEDHQLGVAELWVGHDRRHRHIKSVVGAGRDR